MIAMQTWALVRISQRAPQVESLHGDYMLYCMLCVSISERDAFDTLFDHAPDKLNVVKKVGLCCSA